MTRNLTALSQRVQRLAEDYPFAVHWQVRDLSTGSRIGAADRSILGAFSTRKVSVLLACLALIRLQKLSLDDKLVIDENLKDGVQAGVMRNLSAGISLSLRDHLAQMMITSDNICTQLVFKAMDDATGHGLQWVNDYCAQIGMYDTLHREVFPRSGDLAWHHSIESMTVTSAHDQAHLLELLARGCTSDDAAAHLGLTTELCALAIELMGKIFTAQLGARATTGRFAEKNGRGLRGLSQVGLLLDAGGKPVASVAVFAESIPVDLLDGVPGRARAFELFVDFGQLVEEHFLAGAVVPVVKRQLVEPDFWEQEFGELLYSAENGRSVNAHMEFTFSGIGKVFLAHALADLADRDMTLLHTTLEITPVHRRGAVTGTLRHLTGELLVSVDDAVRLMMGSGDGAATLALLDHLQTLGVDIVAHAREVFRDFEHTDITGVDEQHSAGDGLTGTTTATDALKLLRQIIDEHGRDMEWMTKAFEPGGLACALPGYGPHTVEHWTVSGWARVQADMVQHQGRSSVLILPGPNGHFGVVAHAPVGTQDVCAKFGSLGLSSVACSQV